MNVTRAFRTWLLLTLAAVSLGLPSVVRAQEPPLEMPAIGQPAPETAVRGSTVTVPGQNLPTKPGEILLKLGNITIGPPSSISADGRSLKFVVPDNTPLGPQLLRLGLMHSNSWLAPSDFPTGFLRIVADTNSPFTLSKASAAVVAPDSDGFSLIGEGMGGNVADYVLLRDGSTAALCTKGENCLAARFVSPYELHISAPPSDNGWVGMHELKLRRGDVTADGAASVRFVAYTARRVRVIALSVSAFVLLVIACLTLLGPKYQVAPEALIKKGTYRFLAFLIDPETDTFSLSKFQFYLWSAAALVSYTYLTLSRALAQGHFEFLDIPENLPGILAVSSGTTVASMATTAVRGPKGAGPASPSLSDLLCVGGVVSPERFQFLLWSLVAVCSFLFSVFNADPASISDLPGVPARLLWLSGVSAAGYLGGKMARKPGPVIDQIRVEPGTFALNVVGRNLDADALFEVGQGHPLEPYLTAPNGRSAEVVERDRANSAPDDAKTTNFATILRLQPHDLPQAILGQAPYMLTIINPDGQRASWPFQADNTALIQWGALAPGAPTPPPAAPSAARPRPPSGVPGLPKA